MPSASGKRDRSTVVGCVGVPGTGRLRVGDDQAQPYLPRVSSGGRPRTIAGELQ